MSGDTDCTVSGVKTGQEPNVLVKRKPFSSLLDIKNKSNHNEKSDEDRRLRRWKEWVEIRNRECQKLATLTQRPSIDLVMNSEQHFREVKERQRIIHLAQREPIATLLNGTPWEMPPHLRQRCPCEPLYEVTRTSSEKNPQLEYVVVPDQLKGEKGLTGIPRRKNYTFNDSKYREQRENELKDKMKSLEPHRPTISDLMINGVKKITDKKTDTNPFIHTVTEPDTKSLSLTEQIEGIYAIRINNTVFVQQEHGQEVECLRTLRQQPWHVDTNEWHYSFKAYTRQNHEKTLTMQNLGTVAIRYYWRPADKYMPQSWTVLQNPIFLFKKSFDVIIPGQIEKLNIDFIPSATGVYSEVWELKFCQVPLMSISKNFLLFLDGVAIDEMSLGDDGLDMRTEKTNEDLVLDILNLIIEGMELEKLPQCPYNQLFVERDMFLLKNSLCFYHPTKVDLLKKMYENLKPEDHWDLSILSLREDIKKEEFKKRSELYKELTVIYADLLKPWPNEVIEDLETTKIIAVKLELCLFMDLFDRESDRLKSKEAWGGNEEEEVDIHNEEDFNSEENEEMKGEDYIDEHLVAICKEEGFAVTFYFIMYQHLSELIERIAGTLDSINIYKPFYFDYGNL